MTTILGDIRVVESCSPRACFFQSSLHLPFTRESQTQPWRWPVLFLARVFSAPGTNPKWCHPDPRIRGPLQQAGNRGRWLSPVPHPQPQPCRWRRQGGRFLSTDAAEPRPQSVGEEGRPWDRSSPQPSSTPFHGLSFASSSEVFWSRAHRAWPMKTAAGQEGCFRRRAGFLGPPGALAQGRVRMWLKGCSHPVDVWLPLFTSVSWPQTGLGAHRHVAAPVHFCLPAPNSVRGSRSSAATPFHTVKGLRRVSNESVSDKWVLCGTYYPETKWKLKWAKGVALLLINTSTGNKNLQKQQQTEDPWHHRKVLRGRICHGFRDH